MARYTRIKSLPLQADKGIYVGTTPTQIADANGILADAISSSQVASSVMKVASIPLTAAQINGMYAAPVVVVAAIAGKSIIVDAVTLDITRTATQFAAGGTAVVQYDSTVNGAGTATTAVIAAAVITAGAGRTITSRIPVVLSDVASTGIVGKGLYFSNVDGAFTTGTGTATLTVHYHTV